MLPQDYVNIQNNVKAAVQRCFGRSSFVIGFVFVEAGAIAKLGLTDDDVESFTIPYEILESTEAVIYTHIMDEMDKRNAKINANIDARDALEYERLRQKFEKVL